MALDIEEVLHWKNKKKSWEEKKKGEIKNHKRAMINDLKINRYSKSSIFFRFQWSLNMHAKKSEKFPTAGQQKKRSASCNFMIFFLFNNRFIYWKSNWFTFEHFICKEKSFSRAWTIDGRSKKGRRINASRE